MGYKNQTMHGIRHTASTILNESALFRPDVVETALAHNDKNSIRRTYNKATYLEERKELMQWWADYLDGLRG
jgi:integrase